MRPQGQNAKCDILLHFLLLSSLQKTCLQNKGQIAKKYRDTICQWHSPSYLKCFPCRLKVYSASFVTLWTIETSASFHPVNICPSCQPTPHVCFHSTNHCQNKKNKSPLLAKNLSRPSFEVRNVHILPTCQYQSCS